MADNNNNKDTSPTQGSPTEASELAEGAGMEGDTTEEYERPGSIQGEEEDQVAANLQEYQIVDEVAEEEGMDDEEDVEDEGEDVSPAEGFGPVKPNITYVPKDGQLDPHWTPLTAPW